MMKDAPRWLIRLVVVGLLCALAWWVGRPAGGVFDRVDGQAFATHYRITFAAGPDTATLQHRIDQELHAIDALASTWRDDSELMRYNRAKDQSAFVMSDELAKLITLATELQQQTGGAFSVRPDGKNMDLSAIAKGYAVDRVMTILKDEFGVADALVDIGGEVKAIGDGPSGDGWRVGLYLPSDAIVGKPPVLQLHESSVATSGAYFKGDHILDPATGQAVASDLFSASVIHESNAVADALATALYVMGSERGLTWARDYAVRVVLIRRDGARLEYTPSIAE